MIKEHIEKKHTFTCSACNESFKTKYKKKMHNCFPFLCDCRKKFKTEQDLAAHECHKCKYCNEPFRSKEAVKKHQPRHFNSYSGVYDLDLSRPENGWVELEVNEICAICDEEFTDEKELKGHVNNNHLKSTSPTKPKRNAQAPKRFESDLLINQDKYERKREETSAKRQKK